MKKISMLFAAGFSFGLASCATQPENSAAQDRNNTAVGAVIGAVAGAGIGAYMDRQEEEFRAALEEEQRRSEIEIERVRDDLLKLTFDNEVTFDFDSALVKNSFQGSLDKVSSVIKKYGSDAEVVGHTDSIGSDVYNQQLSERRAMAVKIYLLEHGVDMSRLSSYGKGESDPRDTSVSESGHQLNRRVEIFVRPNT